MAIKLVIDTANLLFRVAAVNKGKTSGTPEEQAGLALHVAFQSVFKYYKKFKPDQIAFTFEGESNWRKTYTSSPECVGGNAYKGNRVKDASMEPFFELMNAFKDVMSAHSSAIVLRHPECEGDDLFAAYVQANANGTDEIIGVSGDRDFVQLLKYPGFRLINPDTGLERNRPIDKEYYEDIDYFIFKKCVRGDMGDYVFSAYPKVRETKIKMAYDDPLYCANFMRETWDIKNDAGDVVKTHVVGKLFEENKLLMDLSAQPSNIKSIMSTTVAEATENIGTYSNFHFLKFLGKHRLNNIAEHIDLFTDMLSCNTRYKKKLAAAGGSIEPEPVVLVPKKKQLVEY
jgi:hypothetical protein